VRRTPCGHPHKPAPELAINTSFNENRRVRFTIQGRGAGIEVDQSGPEGPIQD